MKDFTIIDEGKIQDENGVEFSIEICETIKISDKYFQEVYDAETKDKAFINNPVMEVYRFCEITENGIKTSNKLFDYDKAMAILMFNIDEFLDNDISTLTRRRVAL